MEGQNLLFKNAGVVELMNNATFSQSFYLAVTGKTPDLNVSRMIDSLLIAMVTETEVAPSTLCAKIAANTGADFNAAIAAGVSAMDKNHGLQLKEIMSELSSSIKDMHEINLSIDEQAEITVQHASDRKVSLPGYGKQFNSVDIRVQKLLEKAKELGFDGNFVKLAQSIEVAYKNVFSLELPLNLEGVTGAILLEIGICPEAGPAFFMMAKIPCLVANIIDIKGWK
jgi:citrate synthase